MKFKHKILLIPLLALVAFGLIFLVTLAGGLKDERLISRIENEYFYIYEQTHKLENIVVNTRNSLLGAITSGDEDALNEADSLFQAFQEILDDFNAVDVPIEEDLLRLSTAFTQYYNVARSSTMRLLSGDFSEDLLADVNRMNVLLEDLKFNLKETIGKQKTNMRRVFQEARTTQRMQHTIVSTSILFFILMMILVSSFIVQSIARPLEKITAVTQAVAEGDLDQTLTYSSKDEVGQLADAYRFMIYAQRTKAEAADQIARGNLGTPIPITSDKDLLGKSLVVMVDNLRADINSRIEAEEKLRRAKEDTEEINRELENALQYAREMADRAEMSSQAKSEFLANMSHEIRTPLNAILGFAELLREEKLNSGQRDYVNTIFQSGSLLLNLINDILDFSKIEAGKLHLESIDFDLLSEVEGAADILAQRSREKGLELNCFIDPIIPRHLKGDPARLRQIIINLLGNAIKFTDRGEVTLQVGLSGESEQEVSLQIEIIDTGIGIPVDRQDSIFNSFTQADGTMTRKYGGTGLGLAIAKQLTELMGGKITVESAPDEGSTFTFSCTFQRQEKSVQGEDQSDAVLSSRSVLIVESSESCRAYIWRLLSHWGMKVVAVNSAEEALKDIVRSRQYGTAFETVIIDRNLPDMNGFDLAEQITSDALNRQISIVMTSATSERRDALRCKKLGITRFLTKPVKQNDLFLALSSTRTPEYEIMATDFENEESEADDKPFLKILIAEDNAVNQKLIVRLLEKRGHQVTIANDGAEAVALVESTEQALFDLILMDVQMPNMDGFEATRRIRQFEDRMGRLTPIIAMTAHAMKGDKERCVAAGMDGYLSKPIDTKKLEEVLCRFGAQQKAPRELEVT